MYARLRNHPTELQAPGYKSVPVEEAPAFRGKRTINYEGEDIVLAPLEYVIVRKLEYFRESHAEKHLRDIRAMLAVSSEQLDQSALGEWVHRRGLETGWHQVST